ncbi:uncharacterized protein PF3D7_1120600-like [Galleria mellonella]|uniref:Uncharacterized protein PF3D7_1120600-like n=1 Tax=Galleria mellonella TaxID=7137 RepID=A0ABM3MDD5_GALME|nr:uncharacterized protein PF3D7_1120600-like [Galleria mellonella]
MCNKIKISIFLLKIVITSSSILKSEPNYIKPALDRNNIVNKGIWIRNRNNNEFERPTIGEFIYRPNSLNLDDLLDNNFYASGNNYVADSPIISNYVERSKRASNYDKTKTNRKNIKACDGQPDCPIKMFTEENTLGKSELITKLRPASVFNDYPYEVAILLGKTQDVKSDSADNLQILDENKSDITNLTEAKNLSENIVPIRNPNIKINDKITSNSSNITIPKRSMKSDYESKLIKKIEYDEIINDPVEPIKYGQNVFDKDSGIWQKYTQKVEKGGINERGLIKVLSMLTKTFKKTTKQHNDIKNIHNKIQTTKVEMDKNLEGLTEKFRDFNVKYTYLLNFNEKIKQLEAKEEYLKKKHDEISQNLIEFENQQKKFLAQQRQFYNIQKLMLAQNEKISIKQNLIAKTQSEISHRQNNFVRILKKAKQIYIDSKKVTKLNNKEDNGKVNPTKVTHTTTSSPLTTESIKIDLFSIPTYTELFNQDTLILKDKDEHTVDDLIYKYYFNNTFIDNLMKSKVLTNFVTKNKNTDLTRNIKIKRNKFKEPKKFNTTILIPVNNSKINLGESSQRHREKRWIRKHSAAKFKRHNRGKSSVVTVNHIDDAKLNNIVVKPTNVMPNINEDVNDPFRVMAINFCNEIGQNVNEQVLSWCIEKSLRRLKSIDMKFPYSPVPERKPTRGITNKPTVEQIKITKDLKRSTFYFLQLGTVIFYIATVFIEYKSSLDNEELESNLKQYEIRPDTEGNFYYDGSLHASDIVPTDSDGFSELMPGLDSNSHVDLDPLAFDLQSRRRASVRRINENILRKMAGK